MAWYHPLTPKGFLQLGGLVLLFLGILGLAGIFTDRRTLELDPTEAWAYALVGLVALILRFVPTLSGSVLARAFVALVGLTALAAATYGWQQAGAPYPNTFGVANIEAPVEVVLDLVVGIWGLWAALLPAREVASAAT
jgi:hypothetical protein